MKSNDFLKMHNDAIEQGNNEQALNKIIAGIVRNKADSKSYLAWVTEYAKIDGNAQSVKAIQNKLNKSTTQKMVFGLQAKDKVTQKTRLTRANKPLLNKKLCTQKQIDDKSYLFVTEKVIEVVHTFNADLQKLVDSYKLSKKQVENAISKVTFA
jgi:hypothetical protein